MLCPNWGFRSSEDFAYITDSTYTVEQILKMECAILNALEFNMYGTFQLNFHHFNRIELGLRGYTHVRDADLSCLP